MKTELKNIFAILFMALAFTSCSNDDNNEPTINELEGLTKFKEITNTSHTIELYSHTGATVQGYIVFIIKSMIINKQKKYGFTV